MYEVPIYENCEKDCSLCKEGVCDCQAYCPLYERTVAEYKNPRYLTISPNPKDYPSLTNLVSEWQELFIKLMPALEDGVIVLELAGGIRPHFHCILDVKDRIKFTSTLYCWSRYHNVKQHNAFLKGLHYIFKDVSKTYKETGIVPIVEIGDLQNIKDARMKARRLERIAVLKDSLPAIPSWMLK